MILSQPVFILCFRSANISVKLIVSLPKEFLKVWIEAKLLKNVLEENDVIFTGPSHEASPPTPFKHQQIVKPLNLIKLFIALLD